MEETKRDLKFINPAQAQSGRSGAEGSAETGWGQYVSSGLNREGLTDERVLMAMSRVPRHKFVPSEAQDYAYSDSAVSIGSGQTISQPYIVALMTQEARIDKGSKVLEVGTGSGFQAAVLAELGAQVYSVELLPELADNARKTLNDLGYSVEVRTGDGYAGWEDQAPFDAILVTAGAPKVPPTLLKQLANHGRLVIPLEQDSKGKEEKLVVIERNGNDLITRDLGAVRFVPMKGEVRTAPKSKPTDDLSSVLRSFQEPEVQTATPIDRQSKR